MSALTARRKASGASKAPADCEMKRHLTGLASQIAHGYRIGKSFRLPVSYRSVHNILFFGVGGSAIAGDVLAEVMRHDSPVPFQVLRSSTVPKFTGPDTLAIFSSYSGNTWETTAAFREAVRAGARILILTSGGEFLKNARANRIPYLEIPAGMPPRTAIGCLTFSVLGVLEQGGWIGPHDEAVRMLTASLEKFSPLRARKIARQLYGRVVFLYGPSTPVLRRWRAQLAENAKTLAAHHTIPEAFHNEMEGWSFPAGFAKKAAAVFFTPPRAPASILRKIRMAQSLIRRQGALVIDIPVPGSSPLQSVFELIYLGDWTSYELALLNKVDPVAIPVIERIKKVS